MMHWAVTKENVRKMDHETSKYTIPCPKCKQWFMSYGSLATHDRRHHDETFVGMQSHVSLYLPKDMDQKLRFLVEKGAAANFSEAIRMCLAIGIQSNWILFI